MKINTNFIFILLFALLLTHSCKKNSTESKTSYHTLTFINKTDESITITDNSGMGVFQEIKVLAFATKEITYECPPNSYDCKVDWYYTYHSSGIFYDGICICQESLTYNEQYTFGYCPNVNAPPEESCQTCNNPNACD